MTPQTKLEVDKVEAARSASGSATVAFERLLAWSFLPNHEERVRAWNKLTAALAAERAAVDRALEALTAEVQP